jgi:cobalt-zinc-cadmium efflux system membrane fusion protein
MDTLGHARTPTHDDASNGDHAAGPPATTRRSRTRLVIGAVAALVVALVAWRATRPHPAATTAAEHGLRVADGAIHLTDQAAEWRYITIETAKRSAPLPPVPAPARIVVDEARAAPIFASLSGRVEQVAVQLGQEVKAGDKLVSIRSRDLPELGREVKSAMAELGVKRAAYERVRDLVKLGAVPEKDLLLAEQEMKEAELALQASQGKRTSLRVGQLNADGLYWVTATKPGTVVERRALVGMEVGPDRTDPLVLVAELDQVIVVADVLETDVVGLAPGQDATIATGAIHGAPVKGIVEHVSEFIDPVRRTVSVRVRANNPDRLLRPNAFAQVTFSPGSEPRVIVPTDAVVTDGQKSVLFVRTSAPGAPARLERREVRVGRNRDGKTEILSGLSEGESYVAKGAILLLNALDLGS